MWDAMFNLMGGTMAAVGQAQVATMTAATQSMALGLRSTARWWGISPEEVVPADKRFKDEAWRENPAADFMTQAYLIAAQWTLDSIDGLEAINPDLHQQGKFWARQLVDAVSPANSPFTNPVVWQETARTGGMNLAKGMQNFLSDVQQGRISQVPADAFQVGKDLAVTPGKVIYRNPLIELIQYEPAAKRVHAVPILVIPPWINRYYVMDMRPENSMFKHLVESGFTVFAVSWKNPDSSALDLEWADYMEMGPLEALRVVKDISGSEKVNFVGYCLGGIILQVALAYLAAQGDDSANTATFFTTHQDFKQAGDISVFINRPGVALLEWLIAASGGYLDGRNMAATFNMLRANDLLWNYVVDNYFLGKEPPAFDLLYWNGDGTRVPGRVHQFLVREFFLKNKLMEPGGIQIKGVGIDLGQITTPTYAVAAEADHIVPWAGAFRIKDLQSGPVRFVLSGGGHIAGIVNPPASSKRAYWLNDGDEIDPEKWLAGATRHEGSWWVDWLPWLADQSGKKVAPPAMGSETFRPLLDAPGTYVLEK